jgi:hypothetical protein
MGLDFKMLVQSQDDGEWEEG